MVSWEGIQQDSRKFVAYLDITGRDRKGLLNEITSVFAECDAEVITGNISTDNHQIHNTFQIEITHRTQLKDIFRKIQRIKGIEQVKRTRDNEQYTVSSDFK